eukprot:jgi/Galph1/1278/GphlegSOOS_G5977.1
MTFIAHETTRKGDNPLFASPQSLIKKLEDENIHLANTGWTDEEDRRLIEASHYITLVVNLFHSIFNFMGGKTGQQCLKRWRYTLDPSVKKEGWTKEETDKLMQLHRELGSRWSDIARRLGTGRTDIQCRYRYYRVITGKATNTASKDTCRPMRSNSIGETHERYFGLQDSTAIVDMKRRLSDPETNLGPFSYPIVSKTPEESIFPTKSPGSPSRTRRHYAEEHSYSRYPFYENTASHCLNWPKTDESCHVANGESASSSICPDCGIARLRPRPHSLSTSSYFGAGTSSCLANSAAAFDSLMGLTAHSESFVRPLDTSPFKDGNNNTEFGMHASLNSFMGINNSEQNNLLTGKRNEVLPPISSWKNLINQDNIQGMLFTFTNRPPLWQTFGNSPCMK